MSEVTQSKRTWDVRASFLARNTRNAIREVLRTIGPNANPGTSLISLSIGDPTVFGNLSPPLQVIQAIHDSVELKTSVGYAPTEGHMDVRQVVADYSICQGLVSAEDVILTNGCSHALDIAITAIGDKGRNILIPCFGFPLYTTLAKGYGIVLKYYKLLPDRQWEIDLDDLESQIDDDTAAIIVSNPSNPCGSVYSKKHLLDILDVASRNCVPIISDEIYEHFVFSDHKFISISSLSRDVPVITCSGITKRFLLPGWRMGWLIVHDKQNILGKEIRAALRNLTERLLGPNTLVQQALPVILKNTPQSFFDNVTLYIEDQAKFTFKELNRIPGLIPFMPQGTFYMLVKIKMEHFPEIKSDKDFISRLLSEKSVFCLPGEVFGLANHFRITLSLPKDKMLEALQRIEVFCKDHADTNHSLNEISQ